MHTSEDQVDLITSAASKETLGYISLHLMALQLLMIISLSWIPSKSPLLKVMTQ